MLSICAREIIDQNKQAWLLECEPKGRQEGEQKGRMEGILDLLGEGFGAVPDWAQAKIAEADLETLKRGSKIILGAASIKHVLR
ncbi:MAG: hypothetical protein G8345_19060 [Magnetococcales bacterium]|nr:hypothetical protein [Magnetococcales bacterium]NGZ28975.1 hypothetical protein [Magnetococcales bacterium]